MQNFQEKTHRDLFVPALRRFIGEQSNSFSVFSMGFSGFNNHHNSNLAFLFTLCFLELLFQQLHFKESLVKEAGTNCIFLVTELDF